MGVTVPNSGAIVQSLAEHPAVGRTAGSTETVHQIGDEYPLATINRYQPMLMMVGQQSMHQSFSCYQCLSWLAVISQ